jgi:tetratricopeptide (TPR) repeat protein
LNIRNDIFRFAAGFVLCLISSGYGQNGQTDSDSTFLTLSIQELSDYKKYYLQELDVLQDEKKTLIERGIETGERLLAERSRSPYADDILIRLADLYYLKEKDDFLDSMKVYDEKTSHTLKNETGDRPDEPKLRFTRSMELYQRILDEYPKSEALADAMYNKGFLYEEMEDHENANRLYEQLTSRYPGSRFAIEASMRLGEYYFNPPVNDLNRAIDCYQKVILSPGSPRYQEALYKLGWSHYRLNHYPQAISYFTLLIETVSKSADGHSDSESSATNLSDEAVDYIAVCFVDFGGPAKVREYLRKVGNPAWGINVLQKLGRVYEEEKEDYPNAILAYGYLLDAAPNYEEAPAIQKRISDCYDLLKQEDNAFEARQTLFSSYRTGGNWWNAVTSAKHRLEAYRLCEQALRDNINRLIRKAEASPQDPDLYPKAVRAARAYLDAFPEDSHALLVRWNLAIILDTKMHQYKDALLEYLTISMVYTGEGFQAFSKEKGLASLQDAAENAIVIADTLVKREARTVRPDTVARKPESGPIPFNESEKWLLMAYDNYIKFFPFDAQTPTVLANAGALHYVHKDYNEALKYYKTLVKNFPDSKDLQAVQFAIIKSYFGNGDFGSAEIFCEKLEGDSTSRAYKGKLNDLMGEAIFRSAQDLSSRNQSKAAGDEFFRMSLEAPKVDFVDRALFNAGREYEKIRDFDSAIRAYERLRVFCPGSALLSDALTNLAFDYNEKGEYLKCAARYEELAQIAKSAGQSKDALYNAWLFYVKAEDWEKAVELGDAYAFRYPDAADAPSIYLQTAEYCQKIHDPQKAMGVYSGFPRLFPQSPLVVEAFFRLGMHLFEADSLDEAEKRFQQAYAKNDSLAKLNQPGNPHFAAEALYYASLILQRRFDAVTFKLPETRMQQQIALKQSMLQKLTEQYAKLAAFHTDRLPESLYLIGRAYETFAQTWADQNIHSLDPTARAVKKKSVNERAARLYGQALTAYLAGLKVLEKVDSETDVRQPEKKNGADATDSLSVLSRLWSVKIKGKVSEVLYWSAEINSQTVAELLGAPIPPELNDVARLEYRSQVLIKAVKPLADAAAEAHRKNLSVADSLNLQNAWVDSSRAGVLDAESLLRRKYEALAGDALAIYRNYLGLYRVKNDKREEAPREWVDAMANCVDLSKSYSQAVVIFAKDEFGKTEGDSITQNQKGSTGDALIRYALEKADSLEALIAEGTDDVAQAGSEFKKSKDPRWENAQAVYEDNGNSLMEYKKNLLEETYAAVSVLKNRSPLDGWIAARLIRLDPGAYPEKLNVHLEAMTVPTDTTWTCGPTETPNKSAHFPNRVGAKRSHAAPDSAFLKEGAMQITSPFPDSVKVRYSLQKEFDLPGIPVTGNARFNCGIPARLLLNGQPMEGAVGQEIADVAQSLKSDRNSACVEFEGKGNFLIEGWIRIQYIPKSLPAGGGK